MQRFLALVLVSLLGAACSSTDQRADPETQPWPSGTGRSAHEPDGTARDDRSGQAEPEAEPEAQAGSAVILADRGTFSDGTTITPPWAVHIEMGYTFTYDDEDDDPGEDVESFIHNAPETLLRAGILEDRLELRASWAGWTWAEFEGDGEPDDGDGATDLRLGLRLKLTDQDGFIPRTSVVVDTSVGAGQEGFSTQEVDPSVRLAWSYDLGNGFGLGGNGHIHFPTDGEGHFTQGAASLYATYSPWAGTTFFAEWFTIWPTTRHGRDAHSADFGYLQLVGDHVQFDLRVGFGVNDEAADFFTGAGVSFLFGPGRIVGPVDPRP